MEISFVEEDLKKIYQRELSSSRIITLFTILSIFIASMGVFALGNLFFQEEDQRNRSQESIGCFRTAGGYLIDKRIFIYAIDILPDCLAGCILGIQ